MIGFKLMTYCTDWNSTSITSISSLKIVFVLYLLYIIVLGDSNVGG